MRKAIILSITLAILIAILIPFTAHSVPNLINYQGKLTDSNSVAQEGNYDMIFYLYDTATGGTLIWNETQTVMVLNGIYNVQLGAVSPLGIEVFDNDALYLEIKIGDEILSPRQRITSTAYAMKAEVANMAGDADTVDGIHAADLEESSEIDSKIADHASIADIHHTKTTSFTDLTDTASDDQIPDDITIDYAEKAGNADTAGDADTVDGKHAGEFGDGHSLDAADGNPVDAVYVADNGNVAIGVTTPAQKLDVGGYVRGRSGLCIGSDCRESWPDVTIAVKEFFVTGHEYPYGGQDPYLRDTNNYPYPYLTLTHAIDLFGIDPNDPYSTNWFEMGYSYLQPYTQNPCTLFIEEGDDSSPRSLYSKFGTGGDWGRNNTNDTFAYGQYIDIDGIARASSSESALDNCIANPNCQIDGYICDHVSSKTYVASTSNIKGLVILQIRLKAWWDQGGLCNHDYLPILTIGSWGSPMVTNLKMTSFRLPGIAGDPCLGANINSKIEGKFVVLNYSNTGPDPIQNFHNEGVNITYMIKSLGVAYLKHP